MVAVGQYVNSAIIPVLNAAKACAWCPDTGLTDANTLIRGILNTVLIIVVVAAVVYIMLSGLQYVTSQGDATKTKAAMAGITNAVIGLIVAFAAFVLIQLVMNQLGLGTIQNIPTA
jgi:hypothetical protein